MSYQLLPPELKQYITSQIRTSDIRYAERLGIKGQRRPKEDEVEPKTGPREMDTFFRGRGIDNWSRTSKECREMCLPILFETLEDHRAVENKFQYQILDNPVANAVKHLVLNGRISNDQLTLLLFHIVPRFNNLLKITIGREENLGTNPDFRFNQLLKIAKNISNWSFVRPIASSVEPLLASNFQNIHTLSLDEFVPSPRLLGIIATLPSLANLTLSLERRFDLRRPVFDTRTSSVDFSHSYRLRSLTITSEYDPFDSSVLQFASNFPNLSSLRLSAVAFDPRSQTPASREEKAIPTSFPSLRHLQLSFPFFTPMRKTLQHSSLPTLRSLRLSLQRYPLQINPNDEEPDCDDALIFQIQKSCPLLDLVIAEAQSDSRRTNIRFFKLSLEEAAAAYKFRHQTQAARDEEGHSAVESDSEEEAEDVEGEDGRSTQSWDEQVEERGNDQEEGGEVAARTERPSVSFRSIVEYPRTKVTEYVYPRQWQQLHPGEDRAYDDYRTKFFTEDLRKVVEWAAARIEAIERETDRRGAMELVKGMRELREAMMWMED
ncbi:hypothetical protein JCM3765_005146 [Sporobolomyces pararoseus]